VPLLLKLLIAPLIIGGTTLASRRLGPAIAGWLVSLPLTSGPVVFFVLLEQGSSFAVAVGSAALAGGFALCAFSLAYARVALRAGALVSLAAASVGYLTLAAVVNVLGTGSPAVLVPAVGIALLVTLRLLPDVPVRRPVAAPPAWDLPLRILVGTALIVGITSLAPILGPRASGLAATYPVYVTTLTIFAHREGGSSAAVAMLRGLILGLFGWLAFFGVLLTSLPALGVAAFGAAIIAALAVQAMSLRILRSAPIPGEAAP
jgi:hypothetical protein